MSMTGVQGMLWMIPVPAPESPPQNTRRFGESCLSAECSQSNGKVAWMP